MSANTRRLDIFVEYLLIETDLGSEPHYAVSTLDQDGFSPESGGMFSDHAQAIEYVDSIVPDDVYTVVHDGIGSDVVDEVHIEFNEHLSGES